MFSFVGAQEMDTVSQIATEEGDLELSLSLPPKQLQMVFFHLHVMYITECGSNSVYRDGAILKWRPVRKV